MTAVDGRAVCARVCAVNKPSWTVEFYCPILSVTLDGTPVRLKSGDQALVLLLLGSNWRVSELVL